MSKEKLKLIIKHLEMVVECLKDEIKDEDETESDSTEQSSYEEPSNEETDPYIEDYDEVFYDEED